jgi:hypothetical protein
MTKRQRVFFRIGAWACVATAGIHMLGQFAPRPPAANPTEATLQRLLTTYQKDFGAGFSRTTMDFLKGFSLSFALMLLWAGLLSLLALRRLPEDAAGLTRVARVNAVLAGLLLAISLAGLPECGQSLIDGLGRLGPV